MTFRQNEAFVKQYIFFAMLMTAVTLSTALSVGTNLWLSVVCCVVTALHCAYTCRTEPLVTVDEQGVRCAAKDDVLWDLPWGQIAEVRQISRLRSTAVQLIPTVEPQWDLQKPQTRPFLGFQLSKTAKIALKTYCPGMKDA